MKKSNYFFGPGIEIRFEQEIEVVETMMGVRKPDKNWRHFDKKGHAHVWDGDELPTLEKVVTGKTWVGDEYDGIEVDIAEHRCRECGEIVEPQMISVQEPIYVQAPPSYFLIIHPNFREQEFKIPDGDAGTLMDIFRRMFEEAPQYRTISTAG